MNIYALNKIKVYTPQTLEGILDSAENNILNISISCTA